MTAPATPTAPAGATPVPPKPAFTALVVDDHPVVRESMAARLRSFGATDVVEAASVSEAKVRARQQVCDIAVVDLGLPDGSGVALVKHLADSGWPRIVVLSGSDDSYSVRAAFQAGAQGYLLKTASSATVSKGVREVLAGEIYADPGVSRQLATEARGGPHDRSPNALSAREVQVVQLVSRGKTNKDVGDELGLSALTVKSHMARIGRKLQTGDRAEIVALCIRAGII